MARRKGISSGTTAQRTVEEAGHMRFNTTTNLLEYYDGTNFKAIDTPPTVSTIAIDGRSADTSGIIDRTESGNSGVGTIVIAGSLFDTTGATVTFIPTGGSGSTVSTQSISRDSQSQLTVTVTRSDFIEAGDPYDVKVTNGSGLTGTLASSIDVNVPPVFGSAADTNLGTASVGSFTATGGQSAVATDADGDTVTHTITSGSLPTGISMATNGSFSGGVTGSGSGTSTFTVSAATANGLTATRQFTMSYNSNYDVEYLVVAAGAGGGGDNGGGGGAGGYRTATGFSVAKGTQYTVTVGSGGAGGSQAANSNGSDGGNSVFSTITSAGGGGGLTQDLSQGPAGRPGGSGGGLAQGSSSTVGAGNTPSVSPSQGNPGAASSGPSNSRGGGGGGHSTTGQTGTSGGGGSGGAGTANSITGSSVTYAGGGAGGADQNGSGGAPGGAGGGGNGGNGSSESAQAPSGTDYLGGGGGGGFQGHGCIGGDGGNGVVIIKVPTSAYSGTTTGSPTVTTSGDYKVLNYQSSGTYTA
jgi:hypothetical protein